MWLLHDAIVYIDGVTVRELFVFLRWRRGGERERLHHLLPPSLSPSLAARKETGSLRQGGRELRLAGRLSLSPPCAAQPMLLTRGLKVESFATAPPPPPRSLLPNHLNPPIPPPPRPPPPPLPFLQNCRVACSKEKTKQKQNLCRGFQNSRFAGWERKFKFELSLAASEIRLLGECGRRVTLLLRKGLTPARASTQI